MELVEVLSEVGLAMELVLESVSQTVLQSASYSVVSVEQ
jgi:hypothetical protein